MDRHITILGVVFISYGVLGILVAMIVFAAIAGGGLMSGDGDAIAITGGVATIISGFILLLSIPAVVCGIGILKRRPWARIFGMILGFLSLLNIPFGTLVGIYAIWVLMNRETEMLFGGQPPVQASAV